MSAATDSTEKLYAERDARKLGAHYLRHVMAMTVESLHSKADIAAELAYRDQLIDDLRAASMPLGGNPESYSDTMLQTFARSHGVFLSEIKATQVHAILKMLRVLASHLPHAPAPVDMVLHCPRCCLQHIDAPDIPDTEPCPCCDGRSAGCPECAARWTNPPHRTHLCQGCGWKWRPADVPTNGVRELKTRGKNDSLVPDCKYPDCACGNEGYPPCLADVQEPGGLLSAAKALADRLPVGDHSQHNYFAWNELLALRAAIAAACKPE